MEIRYKVCDRCGEQIKDGYHGDFPVEKNYPMYTMSIKFGMGAIRYNGKMISDTKLDLCDHCLGFFLKELHWK